MCYALAIAIIVTELDWSGRLSSTLFVIPSLISHGWGSVIKTFAAYPQKQYSQRTCPAVRTGQILDGFCLVIGI